MRRNSWFKISLISICIWASECLLAQEIVAEFPTTFEFNAYKPAEAFSIPLDNDDFFLILLDTKQITCNQFTKSFKLNWQVTESRPDVVTSDLMGYDWAERKLRLVFIDRGIRKKIMSIVEIDTATHAVQHFTIPLTWEKQLFVQSISYRNKFYTLMVEPNSSILHLYELNDAKGFIENTFDFANHMFSSTTHNRISEVILGNKFVVIDNSIPNSVEATSHTHKLYFEDNKLLLSFDDSRYRTTLIAIDLIAKKATLDTYEYDNTICDNQRFQSSNSFLCENLLFQTKICTEGVFVTISSLSEKKVIKRFQAQQDDIITWSNTPVIQKGNATGFIFSGEQRELSKTHQFTRKVARSNAAISVFSREDLLDMSIGAYEEFTHPNSTYPPTMGLSPVNIISISFGSYYSDRSIEFISSLEKETLNHREGPISPNVFDKIHDWSEKYDSKISAVAIFRIGDIFYMGHYYKDGQLYRIRKFGTI